MMRTTLYLPENLHQRLRLVSKQKRQSVSKLAVEILGEALAQEEKEQLDDIYAAWDRIKGTITGGTPNLSSNIDEALYGKQGAWRGEIGKQGLWSLQSNNK